MMRPVTLQARLLLLAIGTILATLALTALTIHQGVAETIGVMVDAKMDAQIDAFSSRPAAHAGAPEAAAFLVDFRTTPLDWGWRITRGGRTFRGGMPFGPARMDRSLADQHEGIVSGTARSASGTLLRVRMRRLNGELVEIAAPSSIIDGALEASLWRTLARVVLVTLLLVGVAWLALHRVTRPLRAFQAAIARVRAGQAQTVPSDQPPELRPLAAEINILLDQNAKGLANARRHVAALAHGLKTPLATLALRQVRDGASSEARELVGDLGHRIDLHLGRARVAAFKSAGVHARAPVGIIVDKLIRALRQIHRDRPLDATADIAADLVSGMDQQDLDEIVGNLLDNAFRHAGRRVAVTGGRQGRWLVLRIEDDGPGLSAAEAALVLDKGVRLGGTGGRGLGIGICKEIATLYGGELRLDRSPSLQGLRAELLLPGA